MPHRRSWTLRDGKEGQARHKRRIEKAQRGIMKVRKLVRTTARTYEKEVKERKEKGKEGMRERKREREGGEDEMF